MKRRLFACLVAVLTTVTSSAFASGVEVILDEGTATILGTADADHVVLEEWVPGFCFVIDITDAYNVCAVLDLAEYDSIFILGGDGDDLIENRNVDILFFARGEGGNDTLLGSDLEDGYDDLLGGDGDDFIYGGYGFEYINGDAGNDYIYAANWSGDDVSPSTLIGGDDYDTIVGSPLSDVIVADDGFADFIDCNGGADFADEFASADDLDTIVNCDELLEE